MSRRNDYDYFDLDNFDDSIDSREYRRRQQQRRPASYAARPSSQRPVRRPVKRRNKRRTRNRIIIVASALIILFVNIFIITSILRVVQRKMPLQAFPREQWVQRHLPTKPQNLRPLTKQTSFLLHTL